MKNEKFNIGTIPAIIWGEPSERIFIHVHGKMSRKEYAESFAAIAQEHGYNTLSFDLAQHGERNDGSRCDVWSGMADLKQIYDYVNGKWKNISLHACSIGAYFALNAYKDIVFDKCLFQSPIVDMEWLVKHMMMWSGVTEKELFEKQEIQTDIDVLCWDYYSYILSHPIEKWNSPTAILYGGKDNLQPLSAVKTFADKFGAILTVSENSEHPFMALSDFQIVEKWLRSCLV